MTRKPRGLLSRLMTVGMMAAPVIIGCGGVRSGGGGAPTEAGGWTVSPRLAEAGVFEVAPGKTVPKVADVQLSEPPTAEPPAAAQIELPPEDVEVAGFDETTPCTARVQVLVDDWGAADPCATGAEVGTFAIGITANEVRSVSQELTVEGRALQEILSTEISLCLLAEADCAGTVNIVRLTFAFDPPAVETPEPIDTEPPFDCRADWPPICFELDEAMEPVFEELKSYMFGPESIPPQSLMCDFHTLSYQIDLHDCYCLTEEEQAQSDAWLDALGVSEQQRLDSLSLAADAACNPPEPVEPPPSDVDLCQSDADCERLRACYGGGSGWGICTDIDCRTDDDCAPTEQCYLGTNGDAFFACIPR